METLYNLKYQSVSVENVLRWDVGGRSTLTVCDPSAITRKSQQH